jgi:predicted GTPase
LKKKFEEEFEKQKRETQKPNLIVVGGTGVGKSSLINSCYAGLTKTGKKIALGYGWRYT